jgi:uncharacterized protein (DUF1919 family)
MKRETLSVSAIVLVSDDRDKFLAETIDSIKSQDRQPLEIIIIDSSSQGDAAEIVRQFTGISYYHQPDRNRAFNINLGLAKSKGDAIAFLNAGDLWTRHKLTNQIVYFESHPEVEIVQGFIQNIPDLFRYASYIENLDLAYDFVNLGSLICRRSVFNKVGMFDESLDIGAEIDWFVRSYENQVVKVKLELVTLLYRPKILQSLTDSQRSFQIISLKVLKKHIDRQKSNRSNKQPRGQINYKYIGRPFEEVVTDFQPFTIISDDCWSYGPYNDLRAKYATPFIGIRIEIPCYLELLKDLQNYVQSPLTFTNTSKYKHVNHWRDKDSLNFPIALLKDNVELLFVHESDEDVCREKWMRRIKRIHWDNLFIKFRDDHQDSLDKYLNEFDRLKYENKICFARQEYPPFEWVIAAPDYLDMISLGGDIYGATKKYFDAVNWVKKTHGSNLSAYKIQQPDRYRLTPE